MCGICGVIQVFGPRRPVIPPEVLDRMTDVMTHRGPDDRGIHIEDGAALGVRRLSIVDVAGGHQPVSNESGAVWAAQNGEIYNHEVLREELAAGGHVLRSNCDTEILPHLYEREGSGFARCLRGDFALVVWDSVSGRAVVARDRAGVKPLYYGQAGDLLVFGSELKSVLASGLFSGELDLEAVETYLALGYFAAPRTPLRDVFKLMPGHVLVIADGTIREEPYWELPFPEQPPRERTDPEYAGQLLELLDESVRLRLMSDVPLGAMLSGGLDSSLVVALMARHSSEPVKTFSVAFREDPNGNELEDARLVARTFGTDHHELELSLRDESISLEDLVWYLDEPLADLSSLGLYALSGLAAEHVTVALSGQGADELLGGYPSHRNAALADRWSRLPSPVRKAGPQLAAFVPGRYRRAARAVTARDPVSRFVVQATKLDPASLAQLLHGQTEGSDGFVYRLAEARLGGRKGTALSSALYLSQQLGLVDDMLAYFDRASMARSLEVRVPFLDHHAVEFCARLPDRLKVSRLEGKRLLRIAARDVLPARILEKRKIGFFNQAVSAWFREQAEGAVSRYLLAPEPGYAGILDPGGVRRLIDQSAEAGRSRSTNSLLLSALMLEIWLTTYLPRALAGGRSPDRARARIAG